MNDQNNVLYNTGDEIRLHRLSYVRFVFRRWPIYRGW